MKTRWAVVAGLVGAFTVGCGGSDPAPSSGPDEFSLTTDGTAVTYSDEMANVSISAGKTVSNEMRVDLNVPGALMLTVVIGAPLPTSFPSDVTASYTYILGGYVYTNGAAPIRVTRLDGDMFGLVKGSFSNVDLVGPTTITVSGTFQAKRLN